MQTKSLAALSLGAALLLGACTVQYSNPTAPTVPQQHDKQALKQYRWSYAPPNAPRPIVVVFRQDRINIQTGCNRLGGTWQAQRHQLKVSPLIGTKMGCAPDLMRLEMLATRIFSNNILEYRVETRNAVPILNLRDAQGQVYTFTGSAKQRDD